MALSGSGFMFSAGVRQSAFKQGLRVESIGICQLGSC